MKSQNVLGNRKGGREKGGWRLSPRLDPDHRLPLQTPLIPFNVSKEQDTQLQPRGPELHFWTTVEILKNSTAFPGVTEERLECA